MYHLSPLMVPVLSEALGDSLNAKHASLVVFIVILVSFTTYYVIALLVALYRTLAYSFSSSFNASIRKAGLLIPQPNGSLRESRRISTPLVMTGTPTPPITCENLPPTSETHGDAVSSRPGTGSPPLLLPAGRAHMPNSRSDDLQPEPASQEYLTAIPCEGTLSAAPSTMPLSMDEALAVFQSAARGQPSAEDVCSGPAELPSESLDGPTTASATERPSEVASATGNRDDAPETTGPIMQSAILVEAVDPSGVPGAGPDMLSEGDWTDVEVACPGAEDLSSELPSDQVAVEVITPCPAKDPSPFDNPEESAVLLTASECDAPLAPFGPTRPTVIATTLKEDVQKEETGDSEHNDVALTSTTTQSTLHDDPALPDGMKNCALPASVENSTDLYFGSLEKKVPRIRKHTAENPDWAVAPEEPRSRDRTRKPGLRTKRSKTGGKTADGTGLNNGAQRDILQPNKDGRRVGIGRRRGQGVGARTLEGIA